MKSTCMHSNCLGRIVLILLATTLFGSRAEAQSQDLQIMVNGPWSYVLDPHPENDKHSNALPGESRIILIAPADHHCAYVFSGPDATNWPSSLCDQLTGRLSYSSSSDIALYYLDFPSAVQDHSMGEPNEEGPQLYAPSQVISPSTIDQILNHPDSSSPRFAISLPMPDYVSTYTGDYGSGFAESKVKVGHINYKTPRQEYTIWLVLHYSVNKPPTSLSLSLYDSASSSSGISLPVTSDDNRSGVSIVAFDASLDSNKRCDKMSVDTFSRSAEMWGLKEHVRFPEELDDAGTQNRGFYHYDCAERRAPSMTTTEQQAVGSGEKAPMASHLDAIMKQGKTGENADHLEKSMGQLRKDFSQALSGTSPKDYHAHWATARDVLLASHGRIPKFADRVLSCTLAFMEHPKDSKSPSCPENSILLEELSKAPIYNAASVGSTDCHVGQISINNAFSDILD